MSKPFSIQEDNLLREAYPTTQCKNLVEYFPNRTFSSLKHRVSRLNIKKTLKSDLSFLTLEIPLSFYMMGFIIADGNFSKKDSLKINLSIKDKEWFLNTFSRLGGNWSETEKIVCFEAYDRPNFFKIQEKFDLKIRKTYNPPQNIEFYKNLPYHLFMPLLVGIIDGDGYIGQSKSKSYFIAIELHESWYNFLLMLKERIEKIFSLSVELYFTHNNKCVRLFIGKFDIIRELRNITTNYNLPILKRKWEKIDKHHSLVEKSVNI